MHGRHGPATIPWKRRKEMPETDLNHLETEKEVEDTVKKMKIS
jgi:hypothetical protein